jgi:hypothetical protein
MTEIKIDLSETREPLLVQISFSSESKRRMVHELDELLNSAYKMWRAKLLTEGSLDDALERSANLLRELIDEA